MTARTGGWARDPTRELTGQACSARDPAEREQRGWLSVRVCAYMCVSVGSPAGSLLSKPNLAGAGSGAWWSHAAPVGDRRNESARGTLAEQSQDVAGHRADQCVGALCRGGRARSECPDPGIVTAVEHTCVAARVGVVGHV